MSAGVFDGPGRTLTSFAVRLVRRGGLIVVTAAAGMSAVVVATYGEMMADPAAAGALDALAANPAVRTLFGEPIALDDPGGFTVWRTGTVVAVVLGMWSILATTRVTRGQEDARRWDLLLAGRTPLRSVVLVHMLVVAGVPVLLAFVLFGVLAGTGTAVAGALIHATGLGLAGLFFVGIAAVAAQVFPARPAATGAAVAVLAVGLLARMVGDGAAALAWLRWFSPFGLLELSRPYVDNRWGPLLILAAEAAVLHAVALAVAARRDCGGGLIAPGVGRAPRLRLLGSVPAFALRRVLPPLAGWSAGIGAYFLLIGLIAVSMTGFLTENPAFADAAAQAGFAALSSLEGYTATLFALLAMPVGGLAATRIVAFAEAETDRRLTLLAAQPVHRLRILGAEVAATAAGMLALTTAAGLATWLGVVATGGRLGLPAVLAGVWNTLPIAGLALAAAVLALGLLPRLVGVVGAVPTVGGFLVLVLAQSVGAPGWVVGLSPYAHLAAVPAVAPNWAALAVMTGTAAVLAATGAAAYHRRDLRI